VLFLLATQATFFGPAKYGILPEMVPARDLSRANGVLEMSTFVAIVLGTAAGGSLFEVWQGRLWVVGVGVVVIAVIGTTTSLWIPAVPAASPRQRVIANPWQEIWRGMATLRRNPSLLRAVFGLSYFWGFGALVQLVAVLYGAQVMGLGDSAIGLLMAIAAVGVGIGSLSAGWLSGDRIDVRLAVIGAVGMGAFTIALSYSGRSFGWAAAALSLTGLCGGLFAVPLNALLQHRSDVHEKGRIQATNNFLNTVGIMGASGILSLSSLLHVGPARVFQIMGVLTALIGIGVFVSTPGLFRFREWVRERTPRRAVEHEVGGD
jgi:acyl-[acyl-carrier-protein]-phospholipid O-acyltransferase/long-chain-fatty-acid--[acyl-carrier-protein] ligase